VKLPRDVDGPRLVKALSALEYAPTRQKGSHIRITTQRDGENHEVIPRHRPIKSGTLSAHHRMSVDDLLRRLDF
jgi:predicted RNA binding protein YcfA (HicA-like mRNA interferase family)